MMIKRGMKIEEVLKVRTDIRLDSEEEFEGVIYKNYIGNASENFRELWIEVVDGIVIDLGICDII